jgi:hypothetical protein
MKPSSLYRAALCVLVPAATAYPGMGDTVAQIRRSALETRADAKQLIGDLKTLKDSQLTSIGKDIKAILLDTKSAESNTIDTSIPPGTVDSAACKADLCCVWKWISYEMTAAFNGTCKSRLTMTILGQPVNWDSWTMYQAGSWRCPSRLP